MFCTDASMSYGLGLHRPWIERSASRTMFWCGRPYPITFQPQRITLNSFLTIQVTCLDVHLKLMPGANEVLILFLAVGH